jgi:hypothetical protein
MTILLLAVLSLDALPVSGGPIEVLTADFNHDGKADMAVLCANGVKIVLRDGKSWRESANVDLSGSPTSLAAADFNRDGHPDLAVADHDTFGVQVLRGDGKGGLAKHQLIRAKSTGAPHVHGLLAADLNADGSADILFVSSGEGELVPLLNDGKGNFTSGPIVKMASNAWHPALGDLNGDGHPDAISADLSGDTISIALNDGKGRFTVSQRAKVFPRPFYAKLADLNGDGHPDILSVHDDHGRFTLLQGDGQGAFTQVPGSPIDIGREAYGLAAIDANADGKLDLVAAAGDELLVFLQTGNLQFTKSTKPTTGLGGYHVTAADLDGDGKPELIIPNTKQQRVDFFQLRQ